MPAQNPMPFESPPTPEAVLEQLALLLSLLALDLLPLGLAVGDVESLLLKHYVATATEAQGGKDDAATLVRKAEGLLAAYTLPPGTVLAVEEEFRIELPELPLMPLPPTLLPPTLLLMLQPLTCVSPLACRALQCVLSAPRRS